MPKITCLQIRRSGTINKADFVPKIKKNKADYKQTHLQLQKGTQAKHITSKHHTNPLSYLVSHYYEHFNFYCLHHLMHVNTPWASPLHSCYHPGASPLSSPWFLSSPLAHLRADHNIQDEDQLQPLCAVQEAFLWFSQWIPSSPLHLLLHLRYHCSSQWEWMHGKHLPHPSCRISSPWSYPSAPSFSSPLLLHHC